MTFFANKIKEIENKNNVEVIYCIKAGSKLHGTDTITSDTNYTGIFVPTLHSLITKTDSSQIKYTSGNNRSKNTQEDIDINLISIHKFLSDLRRGEINAVDLLFSIHAKHFEDICVIKKEKFSIIVNHFNDLIIQKGGAYIGFANSQVKKFQSKGEFNYKEIAHALRLLSEYAELLLTKKITFPVENTEYLIAIKANKNINKNQIIDNILQKINYVKEIEKSVSLKLDINQNITDNVILDLFNIETDF